MLVLASAAGAHDSEPINTEFASPLARRTANLNFDFQHFPSSEDEALAGLDFEYGIANRMQISANLPLMRVSRGNRSVVGAGNLGLAYRYLLAGSNERPYAVSINPEIELPTGNAAVADRAYTLGASLHVDAHRGDRFWLHSNFGYNTPVADFDTKQKDFIYAVAAMYELTERWHPVIEVFGQHDFNSSTTVTSVAPEIIYSIGEHWELKAAIPLGASSATPSIGVQFRATWKIGHAGRQ